MRMAALRPDRMRTDRSTERVWLVYELGSEKMRLDGFDGKNSSTIVALMCDRLAAAKWLAYRP